MVNVHVHLYVSNLEASRLFYERVFDAAPVKVTPGYVKFLPTFAPLNPCCFANQEPAKLEAKR